MCWSGQLDARQNWLSNSVVKLACSILITHIDGIGERNGREDEDEDNEGKGRSNWAICQDRPFYQRDYLRWAQIGVRKNSDGG
ncbi:hypothetical protein SAMN06265373_103328 [Shimia sagamensis]|uniref:Uncharacterized protein n=1 Tax=Shimia sagamensis TaxID=1566352 RepID=A0ABY1NUJ8_9RHOB|nr:hypothetical protein SAMN06265373_103328 [Shimia sagamensis]